MDFETEVKGRLHTLESGITQILVTLAENTADLKNHIKRTELNEERIQNLEKWLLGLLSAILVSVLAKIYF